MCLEPVEAQVVSTEELQRATSHGDAVEPERRIGMLT